MNKPLLVITLGLTGVAHALQVVNTTPANNQAGLTAAAGQTFTTPALGVDNKLDTVTVRGPQTGATATVYTMKLWQDTDGNPATWDPGTLVATSTNSIAINTNNGNHVFTFSGETLTDSTVYAVSFNNGTIDHAGFRAGLTNAAGVAIANGSLFSAGAIPGFGGAFDLSFIVNTNSGVAPKSVIWTAATDGTWNTSTTNWKLPDNTPATFNNGDSVSFVDGAASGAVSLSGTIEPASILVDNDTLAYTLGGGPLTGAAALTKDGPGSLTLTANHNHTGGISLVEGGITAGDGATSGEIGGGAVSLAAGTTLTISRSDTLDYKVVEKLRNLSGSGSLVLDGGGKLFIYPGGGTAFNTAGTWSAFSGDITIVNGSELQSIRNGANGRGTGTLILGDGGSNGNLSGIEGDWTWTNAIEAVGSDNRIINRSGVATFARSLKLQGAITGAGNLTLQDSTGAMSDPNRGFVITNDVSMTGTLTIDVATPVRIGGVPGEVDVTGTGLNAASSGSLGTTPVDNHGTLTFSRTDSHSPASAISGTGVVRIGIPSTAGRGDTSTQVVTFADATKTYSGDTLVESGTLLVNGSLPNSFVDVNPEGTLGGTGTVALSTVVKGAVAPGASVGTLTFGDEVIFNAGSSYAWEISDFTGSAGSGYDTLTADDLVFQGTAGTPITIVIGPLTVANFSETAATFTLATSAQAITFIDLDGIVVDGSAFATATGSAGTWDVQLSNDTLSLELVYTPGDPNSYSNWIDGFFTGETDPAIIGFDADPDGDGIDNGVENFLGTDPDAFSAGPSVAASTSNSVTISHSRSNNPANDVSGGYQWSSDLATWQSSGATDGNGVTATISAPVVTDEQNAPLNDTVEVTATITGGSTARLFIRVFAAQPAP